MRKFIKKLLPIWLYLGMVFMLIISTEQIATAQGNYPSPIRNYPLSQIDGIKDISSSGKSGLSMSSVSFNSSIQDRFGQSNQVAYFSSTFSNIKTPNFFEEANISNGYTISFWFYISQAESNWTGYPPQYLDTEQFFFIQKDEKELFGLKKYKNRIGNNRYAHQTDQPWILWLENPQILSQAGWYQVVLVQKPESLRCWLIPPDGNLDCTYTLYIQQDLSSANTFGIGTTLNKAFPYIDDFQVFDTPLSSDQVYRLHADQSKKPYIDLYVNDQFKRTYYPNQDYEENDLYLGQKVEFRAYNINDIQNTEFKGLPYAWLSNFGRMAAYEVESNSQPGEYAPFIPFNYTAHHINFYKRLPSQPVKLQDWVQNADGSWSYIYYAQVRMDAKLNTYTPPYVWPKGQPDVSEKGMSANSSRRYAQYQGYAIEFLADYFKGLSSDFSNFNQSKYLLWNDRDERLIIEDANTLKLYKKDFFTDSQGYVLKFQHLYEDIEKGSNVAIDDNRALTYFMNAYRQNRYNGTLQDKYKYQGWPMMDKNTDATHPFGIFDANNDGSVTNATDDYATAPGQVEFIGGNGEVVRFKFNVSSPFQTDLGFYGHIQGRRIGWKSQQDYTITKLTFKDSNYQPQVFVRTYTPGVEFSTQPVENDYQLFPNPDPRLEHIDFINGNWILHLPEEDYRARAITLCVAAPGGDMVMVGGLPRENMNTSFRAGHVSVADADGPFDRSNIAPGSFELDEGVGTEIGFYRRDINLPPYETYFPYYENMKTNLGIISSKNYSFKKDTKVSFGALDPRPEFSFQSYAFDFSLGSEALARVLPFASYGSDIHWELNQFDKNNSTGTLGSLVTSQTGTTFNYTFNTEGDFMLTVYYGVSTNNPVRTYIHVSNSYGEATQAGSTKGNIEVRNLTNDEKGWLGLDMDVNNYKIAQVTNVWSEYKFVKGPRNTEVTNDRWGPFNNYSSRYAWYHRVDGVDNPVMPYLSASDFKNAEMAALDTWFPKAWVLHYSSSLGDTPPSSIDHPRNPVWNPSTNQFLEAKIANNSSDPINTAASTIENFSASYSFNEDDYEMNFYWLSPTVTYGWIVPSYYKSILKLHKVFDNSTGVFASTAPAHPSSAGNGYDPRFFENYDAVAGEYHFYNDLRFGRAVILNANESIQDIVVKNQNGDFIAGPTNVLNYTATMDKLDVNPLIGREAKAEEPEGFKLYPNPIDHNELILNFYLNESQPIEISIVDVLGKILYQKAFSNLKAQAFNQIKISEMHTFLNPGTYLIKVVCKEFSKEERIIFIQ
ncbi:MAG: T9SS type A sorting domain-containing protein [Microscillaceae bacterium]|nr:T9SS type A sorting domain-containing protein [Microscillaceae bacterium]